MLTLPRSCYVTPHKGAYNCSICLCFTILSYLFPIYPAAAAIPAHTGKVVPILLSKGKGWKREGESPSLFCVFGSFCHITKGASFFSLRKKFFLSISLEKKQVLPALGARERMVLFRSVGKGYVASRVHQKCIFGSRCDPWGKAGSRLYYRVCLVQTASLLRTGSLQYFCRICKVPFGYHLPCKVCTNFASSLLLRFVGKHQR